MKQIVTFIDGYVILQIGRKEWSFKETEFTEKELNELNDGRVFKVGL